MNGWIYASRAAFALGDVAARVADGCARATRPTRTAKECVERAGVLGPLKTCERKAHELAGFADSIGLLLIAKGAIVAGDGLLFWVAFGDVLRRTEGEPADLAGGCEGVSPLDMGGRRCLLMTGHERRGRPFHLGRDGSTWRDPWEGWGR